MKTNNELKTEAFVKVYKNMMGVYAIATIIFTLVYWLRFYQVI